MHKIIKQWDRTLSDTRRAQLDCNLARRNFLLDTCKAALGMPFVPGLALLGACTEDPRQLQDKLARLEPWRTFASVQHHLFPDDGNGPGAGHINAAVYLKFVLEAPDTEQDDHDFILDGVDWLNRLAIARHKSVFAGCIATQREALLIEISKGETGERWLAYLLQYIVEALLSDPVYGGNPGGIGWQWLEHQPGFPHPPHTKRYLDLL